MPLPSYKEIVELVKKGATLEAQEMIMELREASIELQEENFDLRDQVRNLTEKLAEKKALKFDGEVYYKDKGEIREGPFCPGCYDSQSKLVRMHKFDGQLKGPEWQCKICSSRYRRNS